MNLPQPPVNWNIEQLTEERTAAVSESRSASGRKGGAHLATAPMRAMSSSVNQM